MKIYLSGGMHSGWQQRVKRACPGPEYLDPCEPRGCTASLTMGWSSYRG